MPSNVAPQDVWKFTPVSYRTSALWGRCPALTLLLQLITPSRASGTADHVQSLDDLLSLSSLSLSFSHFPVFSLSISLSHGEESFCVHLFELRFHYFFVVDG